MSKSYKGAPGCYAVAKGRNPGVYLEWKDCEAQVLNFNGAIYKKFLSAADAELWIHQNAGRTTTVHPVPKTTTPSVPEPPSIPTQAPPATASLRVESHDSTATLPPITMGQKVPVPRALRVLRHPSPAQRAPIPTPTDSGASVPVSTLSDPLIVYTDGSCRGNGQSGSMAGIGVWFGDSDPRNLCERCPGAQTNNRAELIAIIRVLETTPKDSSLVINSDSEYSMKSLIEWLPGWRARGWKRADGRPVSNLSLVVYADILMEERRIVFNTSVELVKVAAHIGIEGNEAADRLANQGAELPAVPELDWDALTREARRRIKHASSLATEDALPVPRTVSSASSRLDASARIHVAPSVHVTTASPSPASLTAVAPVQGQVQVHTRNVPLPRSSQAQSAHLLVKSEFQTKPDITISQSELELYAGCLLDGEDLLREAIEEGVCT